MCIRFWKMCPIIQYPNNFHIRIHITNKQSNMNLVVIIFALFTFLFTINSNKNILIRAYKYNLNKFHITNSNNQYEDYCQKATLLLYLWF